MSQELVTNVPTGDYKIKRIAMMHPNHNDPRFDIDYYRNQHMSLVREKYAPYGLLDLEIDEAICKESKNSTAYLVVGYMLFNSIKQFYQSYQAAGKDIVSDLSHFSDITSVVQIGAHTQVRSF